MGILNVAALAGAAFLTVPILIHLIHRQRYPRVRFSSLRFFDRTRKHNVIQRRLIDIILLVLRLCAVAALVLALGRPIIMAGSGARTSVAIVLDNSAGMQAKVDGTLSAFDVGRARALSILDTLADGDRACLLLTAPSPETRFTADKAELKARADELAGCEVLLRTRSGKGALLTPVTDSSIVCSAIEALPAGEEAALVVARMDDERFAVGPGLTGDLAAVRRRVASSQPAWRPGSLDGAIRRGAGLLEEAGDSTAHLFVASDFCTRAAPAPVNAPSTRLHLVSVGNPAPKNVGIEDVVLSRDEVHTGEPLKITVYLRNFTKQPSGPVTLTVEMRDEKPSASTQKSIAGGKSRSVEVYVSTFGRGNFKSGLARIECAGDTYPVDDVFYFTIPIRPTARVLCVNGVRSDHPAERETFYLASALSPSARGSSDQAVTGIDVRTRDADSNGADGLADEILFQYDVTVLANVASLNEKMRGRLATYLRDGRSVLVFLGDQCEPEEYNAWGFLPGALREKRGGEFVVLDAIEYDHPALKPFADPACGDLRAFGAYGCVALDLSGDSAARVLARFQNGLPALVEKKVGDGRVILCTTSCHTAWSKWPLVPAFVPFVQRVVKYLASPERRPETMRSYSPGERLLARVEESFRAGSCAAYRQQLEDGRPRLVPVSFERRADGGVAGISETDIAGNYVVVQNPAGQEVEIGKIGLGARQFAFSVNVDRRESDFHSLSRDELAGMAPDGRVDVAAAPFPEDWSAAGLVVRGGSELWWPLLLVVAGMLIAESIVARRTVSET